MNPKIEVTIDVIVHATEDITKFFDTFEKLFQIKQEDFNIQNLKGHFDNPIIKLQTKLTKKNARSFLDKLISDLPKSQQQELLETMEERIHNSAFHLRLDKQKLVTGKLYLGEKDSVKIKLFTPIYNKNDSAKIYSELLSNHLD
ncbi:MAG TPA: RNA-binding domain-containing protein [Nitrosopumilaceae archaeon]|nr:RNA-binding domain-containing protein [Nitrosopumilaceae archaeon]